MKATGWMIKPLGWILLAVVIGLIIYWIINKDKPKSFPEKENKD
ncbi:MAG: hypothetical protein ACHQYP_08995 [Nitrospiria bacterium]